jgi:type IV pilus assembly protein PilA
VLAGQPMLQKTEANGITVYESPPLLPDAELQPVISIDASGALLLATNRRFLQECSERQAGLDQQADFKAALASIGREGNGLTYVTPRFFQQIRAVVASVAEKNPQAKASLGWFAFPEVTRPVVALRINLPDGILVRSYSYQSLKQQALLFSPASPVTLGLMAAMAIPAFQKVRVNSQQKAITNNLRQLYAAAQQYMLETGKTTASYDDLVGNGPNKYIKSITPVAGENYRKIVITSETTSIQVRTADGRVVSYSF